MKSEKKTVPSRGFPELGDRSPCGRLEQERESVSVSYAMQTDRGKTSEREAFCDAKEVGKMCPGNILFGNDKFTQERVKSCHML